MRSKPTEIPTPLRTIKMNYNSDADLSELELTALDKYMELHKALFMVQRDWNALRAEQQQCEGPQQELRQQLTILQAEIREYRQLAGFTKEEVAQMPEPDENKFYDPGVLVEHGMAFQKLFDVHYEKTQELTKRFHELEEETEKLEDLYEDFDNNYFSSIIQNYEDMEMDMIRLDEDFNEFNGLMDDLTAFIRTFLEERNVQVSDYNLLVDEIATAFNRIDRVSTEVNGMMADRFEGNADAN